MNAQFRALVIRNARYETLNDCLDVISLLIGFDASTLAGNTAMGYGSTLKLKNNEGALYATVYRDYNGYYRFS